MVKNMRGRIAVLVTAALALVATPLAAGAAEPEPASIPTITQTEGRLHIVKLAQPGTQGSEAPGTEIPGKTGGIDGVTFEAQRLTEVDLTTAAGWRKAQGLTPAQAKLENLGTAVTGTTSNGGKLTLTLPVGLYLVQETKTPDNVVPAVPFLVTVPMTNPDNKSEWMYDVHVYPKSDSAALKKSISDTDAVVAGDAFTYDVRMDLPKGTTKLVLTDTLDERLDFDLSAESFSVIGDKFSGGVPYGSLPEGVTVVFDGTSRALRVEFTGAPVENGTWLGFRLSASANDGGTIPNSASYIATVPNGTVEGTSNEVLTKWDRIDVEKFSEDGRTGLPGATFKVAASEADARAGRFIQDANGADAAATSDASGRLSFTLRYDEAVRSYWLVETEAPTGYELQPDPIEVTLSAGPDFDAEVEATVVNVRHNAGFELPLIGGNRAILPILAAIVVGGGVIWLVRSRRATA